MGTKKWLALLMILVLAMGTLTGCSPTEQEYYNLITEASTQKVYQDSGSIELSLARLPENMFEGEKSVNTDLVVKSINQHRIDYSGKVDLNKGIIQYDFSMVDKKTGKQSHILSIAGRNDMFYIKIDDMINYLKNFCDTKENQRLDQLYGDIEYVSVSLQELDKTMPGSEIVLDKNIYEKSSQQQMLIRSLLNELLNKVYDKYESNLISKSNNQYTLTLRGTDTVNILEPAAIYTINNIEKLGAVLKAFLKSLAQDEMAELGLTNDMKAEALKGIDQMVVDVKQNRHEYLNEIKVMSATANEDLAKTVNDSEWSSTIEKKDAQTYEMTGKIRLHITSGTPIEEMDITLNLKDTLKTCKDVQVVIPTAGIITYEELEKRMPKQMNVHVDDGIYSLDKGFSSSSGLINVSLENDQVYLSLRTVAESMGEKVGWDEALQQAYVEQNGEQIIMTGLIVDGQTLVKSRDWEKLGYKISWDDSTRTVGIEK